MTRLVREAHERQEPRALAALPPRRLAAAVVVARAPVRVSFGGGGTDLAAYYERFGGFVVSAAITRYCYAIAGDPPEGGAELNSADYRVWERHPAGRAPAVEEPLALPKAAVEWFWPRGLAAAGVQLFTAAEVPPGSGLGSSSAMAVALIRALAARTGAALTPSEVAELACRLEIERLAHPIGKQDQYASALGGLNAIEFRAEGVTVTPLPLPEETLATLSERLLLFATGRTRDSAAILRQQRADTAGKPAVTASLHRIKELAWEMREALLVSDLDRFGKLLDFAWQEKRRLSGRVSSAEIDGWYAAAREAGALGGKITGAGGGGFLLLYCRPAAREAVRHALTRLGLHELGFGFDREGARVLAGADVPAVAAGLSA